MNIPDEVKELYKKVSSSDVEKNYILDIDGTTYDNTNIVFGSFSITEKLCSTEQLKFGESNASMLKLKMVADIGDISSKKITVNQIINGYNLPIGKYNVDSCILTENKRYRDIVAYDNIILFNVNVSDWYNSLNFPISQYDMLVSLCTYIGVEMADIQLINGDEEIDRTIYPEDLKGITVLKSIAELNAGFFRADKDGKLELVNLNTSLIDDYLEVKHYKKLKTENYSTNKYTRVVIRTEENDIGASAGEGNNAYIIQDNFLLYGSSTEKLKPIAVRIYEAIKDISYVPYNSEQIGLPYLKCGSQISYKLANGESFVGLMLQRALSGTQAMKDVVKTSGTKDTKETFSVEKELIKLKGKENLLERKIEANKLQIIDTEQNLSNQIEQTAARFQIKIETLEKQLNGEITVYTSDEPPTLDNYPAINCYVEYYPPADEESAEDYMFPGEYTWVYTFESYHKHLGSIVYVNGTTTAYKFILNENNEFSWLILEDSETGYILSKLTELKATVDGLESTVSATILDFDGKINETSTRVTQTNNRIDNEVVKNDEVISKINASEEGVAIKGKKISLEGIITANKNFEIDDEGNMSCKDAHVSGHIEAESGNIGEWEIKDNKLIGSFMAYVNPTKKEQLILRDANIHNTQSQLPSTYDIDGDGVINVKDAVIMRMIVEGRKKYSDYSNAKQTLVNVEISPTTPEKAIRIYGVNAWGNTYDNYIGVNGYDMNYAYVSGNPVTSVNRGELSIGESVSMAIDRGAIITLSFDAYSMIYIKVGNGNNIVRIDNGPAISPCPTLTYESGILTITSTGYDCNYSVTN